MILNHKPEKSVTEKSDYGVFFYVYIPQIAIKQHREHDDLSIGMGHFPIFRPRLIQTSRKTEKHVNRFPKLSGDFH